MKWKPLLCASVSTVVGFAGAVPSAALAQSTGAVGDPQEAPAATDQSINPTNIQPAAQDGTDSSGAIVVTGLRRSPATAQEIKRESAGLVEAIVPPEIDTLPHPFPNRNKVV